MGSEINSKKKNETTTLWIRVQDMISDVVIYITLFFINIVAYIFYFITDCRIDEKNVHFPFSEQGEYNPRYHGDFTIFSIVNRMHKVGYCFEYHGVYYFSTGFFGLKEKVKIRDKEIYFNPVGLTLLCSTVNHNMKKPVDGSYIYLISPVMPAIRGKCVYKKPNIYALFPIKDGYPLFTGLPIVDEYGELIGIYDNIKKLGDTTYNILGEMEIWGLCDDKKDQIDKTNKINENQIIFSNSLNKKMCKLVKYHWSIVKTNLINDLKLYQVFNNDVPIGYFFIYKNNFYVFNKFLDNYDCIDNELLNCNDINLDNEKVKKPLIKLYENIYTSDSKHDFYMPVIGDKARLLIPNTDLAPIIGTIIKNNEDIVVIFPKSNFPIYSYIGLPIVNNNDQIIGIYGVFKINPANSKTGGYLTILGNISVFYDYSLQLMVEKGEKNIIKKPIDIGDCCKLILSNFPTKTYDTNNIPLYSRIIITVGSQNIVEYFKGVLKGKYNYDDMIFISSPTSLNAVSNKKIVVALTDWVTSTSLTTNFSFPFEEKDSLLIICFNKATLLSQELLEAYYDKKNKNTRGTLITTFFSNEVFKRANKITRDVDIDDLKEQEKANNLHTSISKTASLAASAFSNTFS